MNVTSQKETTFFDQPWDRSLLPGALLASYFAAGDDDSVPGHAVRSEVAGSLILAIDTWQVLSGALVDPANRKNPSIKPRIRLAASLSDDGSLAASWEGNGEDAGFDFSYLPCPDGMAVNHLMQIPMAARLVDPFEGNRAVRRLDQLLLYAVRGIYERIFSFLSTMIEVEKVTDFNFSYGMPDAFGYAVSEWNIQAADQRQDDPKWLADFSEVHGVDPGDFLTLAMISELLPGESLGESVSKRLHREFETFIHPDEVRGLIDYMMAHQKRFVLDVRSMLIDSREPSPAPRYESQTVVSLDQARLRLRGNSAS